MKVKAAAFSLAVARAGGRRGSRRRSAAPAEAGRAHHGRVGASAAPTVIVYGDGCLSPVARACTRVRWCASFWWAWSAGVRRCAAAERLGVRHLLQGRAPARGGALRGLPRAGRVRAVLADVLRRGARLRGARRGGDASRARCRPGRPRPAAATSRTRARCRRTRSPCSRRGTRRARPPAIRARPRRAAVAPGVDLGPPSVTLDPGESYRPNAATSDDYHCFLVDPGLASAQDLVGFDVHPGTPGQRAPRAGVRGAAARGRAGAGKDAAEPGLGWTCFAGSGLGSGTDAPPTIGGWVPGVGRVGVPVGYGHPPGRRDLDRRAGALQPARRRRLRRPHDGRPALRRDAGREARARPADLERHLRDPAGRVRHGHRRAPGADRIVVGVGRPAAHAPARHRDQACRCSTPAGDSTCAIDIPHWNFHWQGFYYYKQPLPVAGGDVVRLACSFDNTAGTAPSRGARRPPTRCASRSRYVTRAARSDAAFGGWSLARCSAGERPEQRRAADAARVAVGGRHQLACAGPSGPSSAPTASGRWRRCAGCWRRRRPARSRAGPAC